MRLNEKNKLRLEKLVYWTKPGSFIEEAQNQPFLHRQKYLDDAKKFEMVRLGTYSIGVLGLSYYISQVL